MSWLSVSVFNRDAVYIRSIWHKVPQFLDTRSHGHKVHPIQGPPNNKTLDPTIYFVLNKCTDIRSHGHNVPYGYKVPRQFPIVTTSLRTWQTLRHSIDLDEAIRRIDGIKQSLCKLSGRVGILMLKLAFGRAPNASSRSSQRGNTPSPLPWTRLLCRRGRNLSVTTKREHSFWKLRLHWIKAFMTRPI